MGWLRKIRDRITGGTLSICHPFRKDAAKYCKFYQRYGCSHVGEPICNIEKCHR